jgi:TolB-like protein
VVAVEQTNPAVAELPPAVIESPKARSRLRPKAVSVSVALALFALAGTGSAALYALHSWWSERVLPQDAPSIAVLPFAHLGDGQGEEFLTDGLADEVTHSLRQIPGLQVVARDSAFRFKGTPLDISEIGRRLHVRTVLVGSVQRDRGHLHITVQLNSTAGNYHIWSGTYDSDSDDARSVPSEIAGAVGSVLGLGARAVATEALVRKQVSPNPGSLFL